MNQGIYRRISIKSQECLTWGVGGGAVDRVKRKDFKDCGVGGGSGGEGRMAPHSTVSINGAWDRVFIFL